MNWQALSATSHYKTALAIQQQLAQGHIEEAHHGITELVEILARSERRVLKSQLIRLMKHIIKWQSQPERRTRSWVATIHNPKMEIQDIQEETPSLTDHVIEQMWDKCVQSAIIEAEAEMGQSTQIKTLSWQDVFEIKYSIEG
ncbi:MAG: DUF29 domain-containing protein [Thiotrichaceae bacterium]|nr:DUF29 domain-containing protein [Thiotrichaceae bacterium]